jgi:hypothetical protein
VAEVGRWCWLPSSAGEGGMGSLPVCDNAVTIPLRVSFLTFSAPGREGCAFVARATGYAEA